ncbi:XrtA/PEP-CTERM system TPR-repeat protein PrsT [Massilia horti]|uniref:PEP-CTERM system TPR-repeat protein PrsT n=1 Tax=Massilia horti TaxID=2562153 RepID=A0A4Y9SVF8_9BURK|nr:XrtA/PEP-CTERM system TPR-repeat protein PrsT [Massilia horti]TFW30700.1 PEP-CTERM system TPR-repeat protein PrsT [Massilia horti]
MPSLAKKHKLTAAVCGAFLLGAGLAGCHRDESSASLLAEAKQYQQKGDQKAALIQFKNAVEKNPQDGEARLALGMHYLDMSDNVSAEKELRKAASLGIAPQRSLPGLAKALLGQVQYQTVLDEVTPALAANSAELLVARGDALLALGKGGEAKQAYEQALALKADNAEAYIGLARLAMQDKDNAAAHRYADEAAAKAPNNAEVAMFKGALLRTEGKLDEALAAYDQVLKLKPDHRFAHLDRAYVEISLNKYDAAQADLVAARKITPNNPLVLYTQALLDFNQGKFAAAQESLQKVLRVAPDHPPTILLAGATELNLGSTQQAEQHLRKYLENDPNNVFARKLLAQAQLKSAQPNNAAATLAPALKEASQDPQLLAMAGQSAMQTRDFKNATAYLEKAAALAPKAAALHTSLGLSHLGQGDREKGLSELELAAELDPKSSNAAVALVQAQLSMKNYDKALAAAKALAKQQPDNPQAQNLQGLVLLAKGDRAAARATFEQAVALQPTFFPAVANLARLDLVDKKPDSARQRFETMLAKDPKNAEAMTAMADLALLQKRTADATTWLEKASDANPDAVAPALRLAGHYLEIKQTAKALTLARKLYTANAGNPDVLDLLGQAQLANNAPTDALETYSKLAKLLPKSALAQLRLAHVHHQLKNDAASAADVKRAVELQPDFVPARGAQIQLALSQGKPDEAIAAARQLQQAKGQSGVAGYVLEGDAQLLLKRPALAVAAYQKAYANAKSAQLLLKLAEALKQAGKASDAQPLLAQWQKEHPEDVVVALYAAESQLANKQFKTAIAMLEDVVKRAPNHAGALNNLAWAYQQEKDPRALGVAEQAYKAGGEIPQIMDTLAWVLIEKGDTNRALPLLQKAVTLAPESHDIRYHLAYGLSKSGDKAGARKELDKLLSQNKRFAQEEEARSLLKTL